MVIKYNGRDLQKRIINGKEVEKVMYNGVQIRPSSTPVSDDYLCFTFVDGYGGGLELDWHPELGLEFEISWDKETRTDYNNGTLIEFSNMGDTLYRRNKSITPTGCHAHFSTYGTFAVSGDVNYLLCKNSTTALTDEYCFSELFSGTDIITPPELPATILSPHCYSDMFSNCGHLAVAPVLPATTLTEGCYEGMFHHSGLVTAPALPATTLAEYCYYLMFAGCISLINIPQLPATTLADLCYERMFEDCISLYSLPALPATTLVYRCYDEMFYGCTNIKLSEIQTGEYQIPFRIPTSGTGIDESGTFQSASYMFYNTGGPFTGPVELNTTYYLSNGGAIEEGDYLCFTSLEANNELRIYGNGLSVVGYTLEISRDKKHWYDYSLGDYISSVISFPNVGDKIYIRNKSTTPTGFSTGYHDYYSFITLKTFAVSGDVNYLLCKNSTTTLIGDYCFVKLFNGAKIVTPPKLTATNVTAYCYQQMFENCTELTATPRLPVTTIQRNCYRRMFAGCTSLTTLPELPATTLPRHCYSEMFEGCSKIKLSETQTGDYQTPYRIPSSGTGTQDYYATYYMFTNTGGTCTTLDINTTYYTSNTVV